MTTGRSGASFFALARGFASALGLVAAFFSAGFFAAGFFTGAFEAAASDALLSPVFEVGSAAPLPRVAVSFFGFAAAFGFAEGFLAARFVAGFLAVGFFAWSLSFCFSSAID